MAKKKDGITDLAKILATVAPKLNQKTFDKLVQVIFSLMHGVKFGYDEMGPRFINDAFDIYQLHHDPVKHTKKNRIKYINNVIKLKLTNKNGIPDLIAIPNNSDVEFIEVKKANGKISKLQEYRIEELKAHGVKVTVHKGV